MAESIAHKKARKKYEGKRILRNVSFNVETDQELINFVNNVDFSNWVKSKILEELKK